MLYIFPISVLFGSFMVYMPSSMTLMLCVAIFFAIVIVIAVKKHRQHRAIHPIKTLLICCSLLLLSMLNGWWHQTNYPVLSTTQMQQATWLSGCIDEFRPSAHGVRLRIKNINWINQDDTPEIRTSSKNKVTWPSRAKIYLYLKPQLDSSYVVSDKSQDKEHSPEQTSQSVHQVGYCGEWRVQLKPIHSTVNEAGFDYEKWAYVNMIVATGSIITIGQVELSHSYIDRLQRYRYKLYQQLLEKLSGYDSNAIIIALAIGERHELNDDHWQVLRQTGTAHLMAISGLHVGLMFVFSLLMLRILMRMVAIRFKPASVLSCAWGALLITLFYALLTGFMVPAQRAILMLLCFLMLDSFREQRRSLLLIAWVAALLVIIRPSSIIDVSYSLSMGAVFFVVYLGRLVMGDKKQTPGHSRLKGFVKGVKSFVLLQLMLLLAMLPMSMLFFDQLSITALIANLLAVPMVSFIILPLCLMITLIIAFKMLNVGLSDIELIDKLLQHLIQSVDTIIRYLWQVLERLAKVNISLTDQWFELYALHSMVWLVLLVIIVVAIRSRWFWLVLSYAPFVMMATYQQSPIKHWTAEQQSPKLVAHQSDIKFKKGEFQIKVLDVGQGSAHLIMTQDYQLLYDTGVSYSSGFSMAKQVIIPVMKHHAMKYIDGLIISHSDQDHAGGLIDMLPFLLPQSQAYSSRVAIPHINYQPCHSKTSWQVNDVQFEFLTRHTAQSSNNASCVLKVSSHVGSVLLTGDIEWSSELSLLPANICADVLLIAHHGSQTSSSERFIDAVKPQIGIISAGYKNRYGHPHEKVIERYKQRNIALYNTACQGQIDVKFLTSGIKLATLRDQQTRIWRHQCE